MLISEHKYLVQCFVYRLFSFNVLSTNYLVSMFCLPTIELQYVHNKIHGSIMYITSELWFVIGLVKWVFFVKEGTSLFHH